MTIALIVDFRDNTMMNEEPFAVGLRKYFETHPEVHPATVSAAAGLNKAAIRKIINGVVRSPRRENAEKIAAQLGMTVERIIAHEFDIKQRHTAVAGKVGAGASVELTDVFEKGDGFYHVATPPNLIGKSAVAVEIVGDSMEPVYSEGDVLFFVRHTHEGVPTEALNKKVIAHTADGRVWVKQIKAGSEEGKFNLLSINPNGENLWNATVTWATPVLQHLPAEFVERVA